MNKDLKKAFIDFEETLNNILGLTPNQVIEIQVSVMKIVDIVEKNEKDLKILEIIKKKRVNVDNVYWCKDVKQYNIMQFGIEKDLTEEEFNLIKEWLENE